MCGIVGFVGEGERSDLERMTAALAHRGPDGEGIHVDPGSGVHLGHRRLAVVDLAGGAQPMWSGDGELGVVFNGEIYNHAELRAELEGRGHRFRSHHSDTETLLYGYREWGEGLPGRLNGMFAFVIHDRPRRRLFAARDRMGEKPFYYSHRPGLFAFASELEALVRHPAIAPRLDQRALQKYFAYGFIPAPHALYEGCRKLPQGCALTLDLADDRLTLSRYWAFRLEPDPAWGERPVAELAEELGGLLSQAVRRRLMSDVPLGIFLSGGIDSSTVLALAARHATPASVQSFAIGFDEPSYDESPFARRVAGHLGCRHREERLTLERAREAMPAILGRMDEPLGDPSLLPTALLSAFTRRHVTVALGGDGGDELFAGYDPFAALAPGRLYQRWVPPRLHGGLRRLVEHLPRSGRNMSLDFKLRRALSGLSHPPELWNPVWMAPLAPEERAELFARPLPLEELYDEALELWAGSRTAHPVDRSLEYFTNLYLPDDILTKVDRASMMVGLEVRAPFLDNEVVEFARKLPHRFKLRRGVRKFLLKEAVAALLPRGIIHRPKKGFGIPVAQWLRELPPPPPPGPHLPLAGAAVERRWREHGEGRADHRLFLWCWLALGQVVGGPRGVP